jgi:prevent-host-death family protein
MVRPDLVREKRGHWRSPGQWAITAIMAKMVRKTALVEEVSVAGAKNRLSELLGRVAYGGAHVLITRRGRPMARLVPLESVDAGQGLADVTGWLDDSHPFIAGVDKIVATRRRHIPRALKRPAQ